MGLTPNPAIVPDLKDSNFPEALIPKLFLTIAFYNLSFNRTDNAELHFISQKDGVRKETLNGFVPKFSLERRSPVIMRQ
jgi:hypothetical protein